MHLYTLVCFLLAHIELSSDGKVRMFDMRVAQPCVNMLSEQIGYTDCKINPCTPDLFVTSTSIGETLSVSLSSTSHLSRLTSDIIFFRSLHDARMAFNDSIRRLRDRAVVRVSFVFPGPLDRPAPDNISTGFSSTRRPCHAESGSMSSTQTCLPSVSTGQARSCALRLITTCLHSTPSKTKSLWLSSMLPQQQRATWATPTYARTR
jgi:hypothetical protein